MNQDLLWRRIAQNEQSVAEREHLVRSGENYRLTGSQESALIQLDGVFRAGNRSALLVAPTGAGKTAVEFRLAVQEFLTRRSPVVVLAPTRDLLRQHVNYFKQRLIGTPLRVEELHGGVAPRDRDTRMQAFGDRLVSILIASGLALKEERYRQALRAAGFMVVDDVNAFDPIEHLKILRGIHTPTLFATATPEVVQEFLQFKGANQNVATLDSTPFETPPTSIKHLSARPGEDPLRQISLVDGAIRKHLACEGRIFVISRTRSGVGRIAHHLEEKYGVPVTQLSGDMVDTQEQAQRLRRFKDFRPDHTRVAMLERFRNTLPAILVGTNLIGAGLDIPDADLIIITDADGFGAAEIEQLIGRVGRRERESEAFLVTGTMTKPRRPRR